MEQTAAILVVDDDPDLRETIVYFLESTGYAVTDNDGVDDSNGETLFFAIGHMM